MLTINNVTFQYSSKTSNSLNTLSLELKQNKILAIVGESGCGKSTLLKLIYGLLDATSGDIYWNNQLVTGPKFNLVPGMPTMKYLAQDFDLMPFITVAENVGQYLSNFFPEQKKERINELLEVVEMLEFANVKAKFLSGGQMQRVALAKVLAKEPELLLLDEPFSHIDNFRKNSLRRKIFKYTKKNNITCVIATHDCNDTLSFADEVVIIKNGEKVIQGNTLEVYHGKKSRYIASLFDDVSELNQKLYYPNEIELVTQSEFRVSILSSYFKGTHFLIEAIDTNENFIFFNHSSYLETNSNVFINIKPQINI